MAHIYLFMKKKQIHRHKKKIMVTKRDLAGGINQEFRISRQTLLYIKQVNKDLTVQYRELCVLGNSNGKEYEKEYIHTHLCIPELFCGLPETNTCYKGKCTFLSHRKYCPVPPHAALGSQHLILTPPEWAFVELGRRAMRLRCCISGCPGPVP